MIRLPRKHIADSVMERILAYEKRQAGMQAGMQSGSVQQQGAQLDAALQAPIQDVAPIEGIDEAIAAKALNL